MLASSEATTATSEAAAAAISDAATTTWKTSFTPPDPKPEFQWNPPDNNPAGENYKARDLLMVNAFIDKSAALFNFLKNFFDYHNGEFRSVSLRLVYPRRFAKTTLLGFIEALLSPLPHMERYSFEEIKTKISALEYGKELLAFGTHPVLFLDMQGISTVHSLNAHIRDQLERAGLDLAQLNFDHADTPRQRVLSGLKMLNEKFERETGKPPKTTKTIVLIDEYDKPFRKKNLTVEDDMLITELIALYSVGKTATYSDVSLLVLCGLTRMVGTGLTDLNNLQDVSIQTKYHGLCGISARELVKSAKGQLDNLAKQKFNNQTFKEILENEFHFKWNGFRFGLDKIKGKRSKEELDPETLEGSLFSPLDVWELVTYLLADDDDNAPSSIWIATMHAEFEFTCFAKNFTSSKGFSQLYHFLEGGWEDRDNLKRTMDRDKYLTLESETDVKKLLLELGLLSVKQIEGNMVLLGSPNTMVTTTAMKLLVDKVKPGITSMELATEYLSQAGFEILVSKAAKQVTNIYKSTGPDALLEYAFQDLLYKELLFCFPVDLSGKSNSYQLFKETSLGLVEEGRPDMAVSLFYKDQPKKAFIIEVTFAIISTSDAELIKANHLKNITKATTQVQTYMVIIPQVEIEQQVPVSVVWHPSATDPKAFELDGTVKYLATKYAPIV